MMVIALDVERLKSNSPKIFFSEWHNGSQARIRLYNLLQPSSTLYKDTEYYIFSGCFVDKNFLHVLPEIECKFYISKQCFDEEIIRHIDMCKIPKDLLIIEIEFTLKRINKNKVKFMDFVVDSKWLD